MTLDMHEHLERMLIRLKLRAIRDHLDNLIDEAARADLTICEALTLFCEREIASKEQRRSIDKAQVRELSTDRFVANGEAIFCLAHPGSERHTLPQPSGGKSSLPDIPCCSCPPRRWSPPSPRPTPKESWRRSCHSWQSPDC